MKLENPPSFFVMTQCQKSAWDNGWRIELKIEDGWILRASHDAPGQIGLGAASPDGPWFLAVDHAGVARELGHSSKVPGPGVARFAYPTTGDLYHAVSRAYDLAKALPDDPLLRFRQKTWSMPQTTEAERLTVQRIGQALFRDALIGFWEGRCPLTGISDTALLRASHMKPWSGCDNDAERLDVYNGILLSALWDAAFDRHLVTFREDGWPQYSAHLSPKARAALERDVTEPVKFSEMHLKYLSVHREAFSIDGNI
ncbi:HNH endonuclease [Ruegeria aquimaris]|uniref:HNH endonuclease n=1 Tax=Ruegeria aquimaris TaxID=2984333 RepID=A0ABT3ARV4_9RHOB|nr:HNH endonuclease signature motif containing protein [Ruegeria sp. XHP0148]MCV2891420.1 HNH endonuclease [Ruegeria sp. XHP0148]